MRTLRFLLGLALLPLCWAVTLATLDLLPAAASGSSALVSPALLAVAAGYGAWLLVFAFLPAPVRAYIWAHEYTHAIWGFLTGARIGRIHVGSTEGYVQMSHAGVLTTLAPYFVPLYTVLVIVVRLLLGLFVPVDGWQLLWLFLVGFTWGFHLTFTLRSLGQRQPDIVECGRVFSYALIYMFNVAGIGLWIVATTPATAPVYSHALFGHTTRAYKTTYRHGQALVTAARQGIAGVRQRADRKDALDAVQ